MPSFKHVKTPYKNWVTSGIRLFAAFALIVVLIAPASAKKTLEQSVPSEKVLLQGFDPNSEVVYTILSSDGLISNGRTQTDENGNTALSYAEIDTTGKEYLVYDLKIANNKIEDYVDILIRVDLKTGRIKASGKGLEQFSDISFLASGKTKQTRSDWSGNFTENNIPALMNSAKEQSFEIALYGFSNLDLPNQQQNPAIIKVLSAPDGGGPDSSGVNVFTPSPSGTYPLSTSDTSAINDTIDLIKENYIVAMMLMTEQLSAVVTQQTLILGQFFDAKIQLEVQRTHQQLKAEAVKDYHPSEEMCRIGSYMRSVAKTEDKARADEFAMNEAMIARYNNLNFTSNAEDEGYDVDARLRQFREVYCNVRDNNDGLHYMCEHDQDENTANSTVGAAAPGGVGGVDKLRFNKDIDYYATLSFPKTLDMDFKDGVETEHEEDVLALAKNLYWPNSFLWGSTKKIPEQAVGFLDARRVIALNSMAHSSYTKLASLKASAPVPAASVEPGWAYMKTLMRDFGISDDDIGVLMGERPSYWAQMEVLTKKIYQDPNFYTNLYDKPANVDRISASLDAIKLMQMRDHYNSVLRREMLTSGLLETELVNGNHYSRAGSVLTILGN